MNFFLLRLRFKHPGYQCSAPDILRRKRTGIARDASESPVIQWVVPEPPGTAILVRGKRRSAVRRSAAPACLGAASASSRSTRLGTRRISQANRQRDGGGSATVRWFLRGGVSRKLSALGWASFGSAGICALAVKYRASGITDMLGTSNKETARRVSVHIPNHLPHFD